MGARVRLIEPNSFKATEDGYRFNVRLNWYRSLAISCIEDLTVTLDGQVAAPETVRLEVNGKELTLAEAEEAVETYWFVQDGLGVHVVGAGQVHVVGAGQVKTGETHQVAVAYGMRAPYIAIGPGRFLVNLNTETTTCVAA